MRGRDQRIPERLLPQKRWKMGTNTQGCPLTSVRAWTLMHVHAHSPTPIHSSFMVVLLMDILSAKYYCSYSLKNRRMFVIIHNPFLCCWESNPEFYICWASTLPLRYTLNSPHLCLVVICLLFLGKVSHSLSWL